MKPRILKKLCKKVREISPQVFLDAWVDEEDFAWGRYRRIRSAEEHGAATAKQKRWHHYSKSNIRHCWMIGGDPDYWGEITEPYHLYDIALDRVLWHFGVENEEDGWPRYHKALTGQEVLKKYRELHHA